MIAFLKISKKLYWLGLIGLIGTFFHIPGLKLFYLFFSPCDCKFHSVLYPYPQNRQES